MSYEERKKAFSEKLKTFDDMQRDPQKLLAYYDWCMRNGLMFMDDTGNVKYSPNQKKRINRLIESGWTD